MEEYVEDFPTGVPQELVALFKDVARESDDIIEGTADTNELSLICRTLANVATYAMNLLDHANTAQTPRGLTRFLERIRDNLQKDSVLLVTPLAGYNYTIGDHFPTLDRLLRGRLVPDEKWDSRCTQYKKGLNVVRFPRIERDNVLLHAIFGHEFGHPIADTFLMKDQTSPEYHSEITALNSKVNKEFESVLATESNSITRVKLHGEMCTYATEIRRRGLEELISDAVAAFLFGPSALFAAAELLVSDGLDQLPQPQEFYPSSRFRLRVMCKVLADTGHLDAIRKMPVDEDLGAHSIAVKEYLARLEAMANSSEDVAERDKDPLVRIAYEWVDKSLEIALESAAEAVSTIAYQAKTMTEETPEALRRLSLGLPPSEVGIFPEVKAIDWRTTILAGWIHKIYLLARLDLNWIDRRDQIRNTQSLALKGIEDSFLRSEYLTKYPNALTISEDKK